MGAGASSGLNEKLEKASEEDLKKEIAALDPEALDKLKKALAASKWKIETVPADGVLVCAHPGSGNAIPLMLFGQIHLKEKYKFQMCDIMKGEQMSPDFLAMNPFHQIPSAKMADGTCLFESSAALRYLARKFAPDTYPPELQLTIDMAMDKRQTNLYKAWAPIGYYAMMIGGPPEKDAAKKLTSCLNDMANFFLKGKFIGGDKLCIADYSLAPFINTLCLPTTKKIGYKVPERWAKYLDDVKEAVGDAWSATEVHNGWVGSNESKVQTIEFDESEDKPGTSDWKMETVPDEGVLVCGHPGSGNVIPAKLFGLKHLEEAKFKFQMCDIMKGEQWSSEYLAVNPWHEVPIAKLADGTGMFESSSILRCLARKFAPDLYPEDKQLIIDMAMDKRQMDLYKAWTPIGYYSMQIAPKPATDAAKNLNGVLGMMAEAFLKEKYVGGAKLSIADYSILPLIYTLSLPTTAKVGYKLPDRWAQFLSDAKADLGKAFEDAGAEHTAWVASNEEKVEKVDFEA